MVVESKTCRRFGSIEAPLTGSLFAVQDVLEEELTQSIRSLVDDVYKLVSFAMSSASITALLTDGA